MRELSMRLGLKQGVEVGSEQRTRFQHILLILRKIYGLDTNAVFQLCNLEVLREWSQIVRNTMSNADHRMIAGEVAVGLCM